MGYAYNYAVSGLQEPDKMNVLSLEQKTSRGNTFRFDDTGNHYRVTSCGEPSATEFDAANLALNGTVTLTVELMSKGPVALGASLTHSTNLPIDEWSWGIPTTPFVGCGQKRNPIHVLSARGKLSIAKSWTKKCGSEKGIDSGQFFICPDCALLYGYRW